MDPWKRRFLLETIISRFHVNFWGCIWIERFSPKLVDDEAILTKIWMAQPPPFGFQSVLG